MGLLAKLSLLLGGCVLGTAAFTTLALSRFFAADQEAYLSDFQSNIALTSQRALERELELLHTQAEPLADPANRRSFASLVSQIPGVLGAELWAGGKLLARSPQAGEPLRQPPQGFSRWALDRAPDFLETPALRWSGRYGEIGVSLYLRWEWLSELLGASHGAAIQIVQKDGIVLLQTGRAQAITGREVFNSQAIFSRVFGKTPGIPQTMPYTAVDGTELLGTFLSLSTEPPLLIVVKTPLANVRGVIKRTYRQALLIVSLFLLLSILIGVGFSTTLTSPLKALAAQTVEVAKGKFDVAPNPHASRRDEVGSLARSFNLMSEQLSKLREELRRQERLAALGKFSAAIAHEIKNPLGGILGQAQLAERSLAKAPPNEKSALAALALVKAETIRANNTVMRLMKFARQEKPPTEVIDLVERVRLALALLTPLADQSGVTVESSLPEAPIYSVANADQIQEVVLNLAQNAIHAMRACERKRLSVSLEVRDDKARLQISDTGQGIAADAMKHLFEPFFTTKPIGEGTGLGLATCHGIILNHKGQIEVQSEPGKGSQFVVTLPTAPAPVPTEKAA